MTNLYLYGQDSTPELQSEARIRVEGVETRISIDAAYYMSQGVGRFLGAMLPLIQRSLDL